MAYLMVCLLYTLATMHFNFGTGIPDSPLTICSASGLTIRYTSTAMIPCGSSPATLPHVSRNRLLAISALSAKSGPILHPSPLFTTVSSWLCESTSYQLVPARLCHGQILFPGEIFTGTRPMDL